MLKLYTKKKSSLKEEGDGGGRRKERAFICTPKAFDRLRSRVNLKFGEVGDTRVEPERVKSSHAISIGFASVIDRTLPVFLFLSFFHHRQIE